MHLTFAVAIVMSVVQGYRPGTAEDFSGQWKFATPDGTTEESLELAITGTDVIGQLTAVEHGFFSRRTTVKGRVNIGGTLANGALQLRVWPADASPNAGVAATARLRGEYLILRAGDTETGYARPGRSLVESAKGSSEAAALARAVTGHVYSRTSQVRGRDGAIVGARVRLALCANGSIEYDASDVGSAPNGGSMGGTVTRRGTWTVVLHAGAPVVEARWEGTGTSYSLTRYFRVRPDAAGRSANVDGDDLPATGRC